MIEIIKGVNSKPIATEDFVEEIKKLTGISGTLFIGYPLISTPDGKYSIDATFVSKEKGIVLFDFIESSVMSGYEERQDDIYNKISSKLILHKGLLKGKRFIPDINVMSFCSNVKSDVLSKSIVEHTISSKENLIDILSDIESEGIDETTYKTVLSAIENITSIRSGRSKRETSKSDSRGKKLKDLEASIATLDHRQNRAVIETVDDVQRIRGLAGSGKTIVLALKAAYLHSQFPDWNIAVTFHTRALKGQYNRLINNFCIEQTGEEPNWEKIRIINAWGAPGGQDRTGVYYEFCQETEQYVYDFRTAADEFGDKNAFSGACELALKKVREMNLGQYDVILVDEAQDFTPSFLNICYRMLGDKKRLVYAYDELQNLSDASLPPPEDIFGRKPDGTPLVSLVNDLDKRDVTLNKCYRNSRPILTAAHSLGFGIYRSPSESLGTGLVQMFEQPSLWEDIGYNVVSGNLIQGANVSLSRSNETSPVFLESHSDIDDIISFEVFGSVEEQNEWLITNIKNNLQNDELRCDDIMVINPNPIGAKRVIGPIRARLFEEKIQSHIAGVDVDPDVFFKTDTDSITFTSIYRAKGNEAGMVYIINAHECNGEGVGLSRIRNQIFTAITRSKAWVRVLGVGYGMEVLKKEFDEVKKQNFHLNFEYPNDDVLSKLRVIHRDVSPYEKQQIAATERKFEEAVNNIIKDKLSIEDISDDIKAKLFEILFNKK